MEKAERDQLEEKLLHVKDMISEMQQYYQRTVQLNNEYNQVMASYQEYEPDEFEDRFLATEHKINLKVPIVLSTIYAVIRTLARGVYNCHMYNDVYYDMETFERHDAPEVKMTYFEGCITAIPQGILVGLGVAAVLIAISYLICKWKNLGVENYKKEIAQKNEEIHRRNEVILANNRQCDARIQKMYQEAVGIKKAVSDLQTKYTQYIQGWYPADMSFIEAVESFWNNIHYYRADSMKEAQLLFIQKKQSEILNSNVRQGVAVICNRIDNLADIERYNGQMLRMVVNNQEILIKQTDAINRNLMMGFASVNLTNIMNTASINQNINSAASSINANISAGAQSINRKLDDIF